MTTRTPPSIAVDDANGAAARDAFAIASGIPSRALMQRAGAAAAAEIVRRFPDRIGQGVVVATGAGNNGGDGWVVAAALHAVAVGVRVVECIPARSPDARAERASAVAAGVPVVSEPDALLTGGERLAVDALVGIGLTAARPLDGGAARGVEALRRLEQRGTAIIALDVPSLLDASTGDDLGAPRCALTLTFGTIKRGHLVARTLCGEIVVLDIGLGAQGHSSAGAYLATAGWFRAMLPPIAADAHKGTRRKIVILSGAAGMAGAAMLAARGALRSGAGMVRCLVASDSVASIQEGEPAALVSAWPMDDAAIDASIVSWADAVLIGPGLGRDEARDLVERVLHRFRGPVVLDAGALTAFAGDTKTLRMLIGARAALLTPHAAEFARLAECDVSTVLAERFTMPIALARDTMAAVLLKGVPTIVAATTGDVMVIAEGTPMLATGGAGDVLGGIAVTLLAQTGDAALAGALAAFAHGRAAHAVSARAVRGYTLDDVLHALPEVWSLAVSPPRPPILADLPPVGEEGMP